MPKNVVGKKRDGELSQMIWGCFMSNKLGPIAFVDGSIKKVLFSINTSLNSSTH